DGRAQASRDLFPDTSFTHESSPPRSRANRVLVFQPTRRVQRQCHADTAGATHTLSVEPLAVPVGMADRETSTSEDCGEFRHCRGRHGLTNSDSPETYTRHSVALRRAPPAWRRLT